jgi:hypothetical protein
MVSAAVLLKELGAIGACRESGSNFGVWRKIEASLKPLLGGSRAKVGAPRRQNRGR